MESVRQPAGKVLASENAALETLERSIEKEREEEKQRKQKLESEIIKNRFESAGDMLSFILPEAEITIECNPDDVDDSFAAAIADLPVNRVSMGVAEGRVIVDIDLLKEKCALQHEVVSENRSVVNTVSSRIQWNEDKLEKILEKLDLLINLVQRFLSLGITLDSGALVGELAPMIDYELGIITEHKGRGN